MRSILRYFDVKIEFNWTVSKGKVSIPVKPIKTCYFKAYLRCPYGVLLSFCAANLPCGMNRTGPYFKVDASLK